jgi:hypothetical protein
MVVDRHRDRAEVMWWRFQMNVKTMRSAIAQANAMMCISIIFEGL